MKDHQIKITTFRRTGRYYDEKVSNLLTTHQDLQGWQLNELFQNGSESLHLYCPSGRLDGEFFYVVQVKYPEGRTEFCELLLNNTR